MHIALRTRPLDLATPKRAAIWRKVVAGDADLYERTEQGERFMLRKPIEQWELLYYNTSVESMN